MTADPDIVIVGSGFAGLCLGMSLERAGIDSFVILEKENDIGGTWRDNVYPGAACDVPSFSYCFSFEQRTSWSRKWAPQAEILDYIRHCSQKYDLARHTRLGSEVSSARFDEATARWTVETVGGQRYQPRFLVSAVGQLNRPSIPKIPGLSNFGGTWFHSARWNREVDLSGKSVAVIGNAASAVQFVPEIAKVVSRLTVFQRSPNWIIPKNDGPYTPAESRFFARFPFFARLYRWLIWFLLESRFPVLKGGFFVTWIVNRMARKHLETQIPDPELRKVLTPSYPVGAKRILITDDYYPALMRDNVTLVTSGVEEITREGIRTKDGVVHPADVLILATGFDTTSFLAPMKLTGRGERTLEQAWQDGAEAYLGITLASFPNFFMMYGPNTNLGHNSILFMLECQSNYIVRCIERTRARRGGSMEVLPDVFATYNTRIQEELRDTVWAKVEASWYKTKSGRITNNWYGPTWKYWLATRRPDFSVYRTERDPA